MRTPSGGGFSDLATRFQRIADEFTRADRDSAALASSLRDLAAGVGGFLVDAVREGRLEPPAIEGSWLHLALRPPRARLPTGQPPADGRYQKAGRSTLGFHVAYRDLRELEGVSQVCSSSESTPREQLEGLAVHFSGLLWSVGGKRGGGVAAKDAGACLMRLVFVEAATTWLRERHYPHEPAVELARCEVEFEDRKGKAVALSLLLDRPAWGDTPADEAWRQVATHCAAACRALASMLAPAGVDEAPPVPNERGPRASSRRSRGMRLEIRRQVKAEIKSMLSDDALVAAYRAQGSCREAAAALSKETGSTVSKDKVYRAVCRSGGIEAARRRESSRSIVRAVPSHRRVSKRKDPPGS